MDDYYKTRLLIVITSDNFFFFKIFMKRSNRFFLFISIFVTIINAQFPGEEIVWKGINAFYNYQTVEAVEILSQARIDYPEHPAVHLTWTAAKYLDNQANKSISFTYKTLQNDLSEVIQIYEDLIDKYPQTPEYELFLGSAVGFRARVHLGKKEWIQTLTSAYRGYKIVTQVDRKYPDLTDNQLPIGIVEYYASLSGPIIQFATNILGFSSEYRSGLNRIKKAADSGPYSWIEGSSILSFISLWVEDDPATSFVYSKKLVDAFPGNYYFQTILMESKMKLNKDQDFSVELKDLEEKLNLLSEIQKKWYLPFLNYEKALHFFYRKDFDSALESLDQCISEYSAELDMVLGESYLLKGRIFDLKGERPRALKNYRLCMELDNNTSAMKNAKSGLTLPYKDQNTD